MHGFGLNHHNIDHLIGPGRPLDSKKYFIVCVDTLGNTQTAFEHSTSPTNSGLKMQFPLFNGRDQVNAAHKLLTESIGIRHLLASTGISWGGYQSMQLAVSYPDFVDGIVPIVGTALWSVERTFRGAWMLWILRTCAGWDGGNYSENPKECATNAISKLIPMLYSEEWWRQYVDVPEAYTRWRIAWGEYYLDIQDARDLYYGIRAVSLGWLGDTPGFNDDYLAALRSIKAKTLFITSKYDQFYSPQQIDLQAKTIPDARVVTIDSVAGHMICCSGDPQATRAVGLALGDFLTQLTARRNARN
jgi:homoserine O-acetyltransferase/O-succinyltransferase